MFLGEFLSLLCALLWAFAVICYRKAGHHFSASLMNWFKITATLLLMVPTLLLFEPAALPALSLQEWSLISVSGILGIMVADWFYLRALQLIGAGLSGLTGSLYSPFVVLLSFFYLGERLNGWQFIGMALVMFGVLIISLKSKNQVEKHPPLLGFVYAALGVLLTAVGIVIIKPISNQVPFFWIIAIRALAGWLSMLVFNLMFNNSLNLTQIIRSKGFVWLLAGAILGQYLSTMVWVAGYKYTSASVASILNETASIFILILSWLLLKEPISHKKIIGAGISSTGVILVLYFSR